MIEEERTDSAPTNGRPNRVRLPGFITDEDIGLGDVIKRATYRLGIKPCGGCEGRAAALNRWLVVGGRRK
jgi:hypothetical protein